MSIDCDACDQLQLILLIYVININFTILWIVVSGVLFAICVAVNCVQTAFYISTRHFITSFE